MKLFAKTLAAVVAIFAASAASAITWDFTGGPGAAQSEYSFGDLTVSAKDGADVWHGAKGLGVAGNNNKIDGDDKLVLKFTQKLFINSFSIKKGGNDEIIVRVKGATGWINFGTLANNTQYLIEESGKKVLFGDGNDNGNGYYLSSISVPDSGTSMALLGLGLVGLVGLRRRFNK